MSAGTEGGAEPAGQAGERRSNRWGQVSVPCGQAVGRGGHQGLWRRLRGGAWEPEMRRVRAVQQDKLQLQTCQKGDTHRLWKELELPEGR